MKALKLFFVLSFMLVVIFAYSQEQALKVEFLKTDNYYLKTLNDGKKECVFLIDGIKSQKQAESLQNYIRGYRGVQEFNLIKEASGKYKASGIYYSFANAAYFKYLFQLINVDKVFLNNEWIKLEQLNTL